MLHNKQPYYFGRSNPRLQSRSRLVRRPTKLASIDCHRSDPGGKRLAVFVSGTGSNFRKIHESCQNKKIRGAIAVLITNNLHCPAAEFATNCDIPIRLYPSKSDRSLVPLLKETFKVDIVLLAGYLKLLPADIIRVTCLTNVFLVFTFSGISKSNSEYSSILAAIVWRQRILWRESS